MPSVRLLYTCSSVPRAWPIRPLFHSACKLHAAAAENKAQLETSRYYQRLTVRNTLRQHQQARRKLDRHSIFHVDPSPHRTLEHIIEDAGNAKHARHFTKSTNPQRLSTISPKQPLNVNLPQENSPHNDLNICRSLPPLTDPLPSHIEPLSHKICKQHTHIQS